MEQLILINLIIFGLSFLSGMLGLGVAFVATPVLGLFGFELKHAIMPWALLLNGLTAISAAVTYLRRGMVDLRTGMPLLVLTTLAAPLGVYLLRFASTTTVWWIFVAVLVFLAARMLVKRPGDGAVDVTDISGSTRILGFIAGTAIGVFAGFLGVGPGFLLMPTLVLLGYTARIAAATNALVVTLPSFSAFAAHWATAQLDPALLGTTAVTSIAGAQLGAAFMASRVRSRTLEVVFAVLLAVLAIQRAYILLR
ncbi:MAG: sulfite exporter TauE/SafE family protein [Armatimonadota bacterium]|nr:sulfite exporter TauE/SafE family protein [Armatimonadota bacterium]MDR7422376.1 sulfite exporter TauE/SafE family protein [Armatimonadota bacterium]MDR7454834.1 sulfite exporter TauE/SafE family protein [Armatimonadota bacterium]MDR7457786.1 sulfite exporter TauE/SafE family protein [Armatimonadota bacterium]MDR7497070.1 sulfite exporter TauE/SafE family protein [Armatimonadota bacterium]